MRNGSQNVINWRRRAKEKLVEYKGGKCEICGYNKPCYSAYVFHHPDPTQKDFGVSGKSWSFERLQVEVDKCQLLCVLCHSELHDQEYEKCGQQKTYKPDPRVKTNPIRECQECGEQFTAKREKQKYCSKECSCKSIAVHRMPEKEILEELCQQINNIEIGKIYSVSEAAVRKWKKKLGIISSRYTNKSEI